MFQVTSSETMKCPSKEIDTNNISLLLPKHNFLNSLFESQHSLCLFLLVVLWCFCSPWRSDVFVLEQAGWLRNTPVCPQRSVPVLFCLARLRGCRGQSLPLRHWALTCTHIASPLLYSNLLQALLHYCLARPGAV